MVADYPAAHSMDTSWFAVDKEGHVACFDTGEEGLMPNCAGTQDHEAIAQWLGESALAGGMPVGQRSRALRRSGQGEHCTQAAKRPPGPVIFFLTAEEAALNVAMRHRARFAHSVAGPAAVILDRVPRTLATQLHRDGVCRGCYPLEELEVFSYSCHDYGPFPYQRDVTPSLPLHLDQLPPGLRQAVQLVAFDALLFADAPKVQPAEFFPCHTWGECCFYIAADGRHLRPMKGMEREYRQLYDSGQLQEFGFSEEIVIEPPTTKKK